MNKNEFKQKLNRINISHIWDWITIPIILLLLVYVLTGCSSTQPTAVKVVTQEVFVPKMVYCIDKKDVPVYNEIVKTKINKSDSDFVKVKKLIIRDNEQQQFANIVIPLLKGCSKE